MHRRQRSPDCLRSRSHSDLYYGFVFRLALAPGGVALHAARISGGAPALAVLRRGGEAAFRPLRLDLDDVAALGQFVAGFFRHALLDLQDARSRGARPERDWEVLGVPG